MAETVTAAERLYNDAAQPHDDDWADLADREKHWWERLAATLMAVQATPQQVDVTAAWLCDHSRPAEWEFGSPWRDLPEGIRDTYRLRARSLLLAQQG